MSFIKVENSEHVYMSQSSHAQALPGSSLPFQMVFTSRDLVQVPNAAATWKTSTSVTESKECQNRSKTTTRGCLSRGPGDQFYGPPNRAWESSWRFRDHVWLWRLGSAVEDNTLIYWRC